MVLIRDHQHALSMIKLSQMIKSPARTIGFHNAISKLCQDPKINKSENESNNVDPGKLAHYEPPYLDLHSLQISLFSFSVL